jgi:hypothetical protein
MQKGVESLGEFVAASGKATELLESVEEPLDQIPCLVAMPVDRALYLAIGSRRDDGLRAGGFDGVDQFVAVVSLVRDDGLGRYFADQCAALRHVGDLPAGEDQAQRITQGIDAGVNFGGQPASRPSDRLIATVFLGAPAACWWARTTVESMNNSSKSASPRNASATLCQTPYVSQRANRTYTECHLPNSAGRSRHGLPTRAVYRTASTNRRLSAARPPLSVGFPGNMPPIRCHCSSLNIRRSIVHIQTPRCEHKTATVNRP